MVGRKRFYPGQCKLFGKDVIYTAPSDVQIGMRTDNRQVFAHQFPDQQVGSHPFQWGIDHRMVGDNQVRASGYRLGDHFVGHIERNQRTVYLFGRVADQKAGIVEFHCQRERCGLINFIVYVLYGHFLHLLSNSVSKVRYDIYSSRFWVLADSPSTFSRTCRVTFSR